MSGHYSNSVCYGDEYYSLLLLGGHALTSLEGGGPCSLSTLNYRAACHLALRLITTQLLTKPGDQHWGNFGPGCGHPGKVQCKEKTKSSLFIKESVKVPGMGPGESYTGLLGRSIQQNGY